MRQTVIRNLHTVKEINMFVWMVVIGTVVTLIVIYLVNQANTNPAPPSTSYTGSSTYSPLGPTKKIPILKTPSYPTIYTAYKTHYPIVREAVMNAMNSMDYWNHISVSELEAEISCFMLFVAVRLSSDEQKVDGDDFTKDVIEKIDEDGLMNRIKVYDLILNKVDLPRVDWGRPISKYEIMKNETAFIRAFAAFGDFLINPECRTDYFNAPSMSSTLVIDSFPFYNFFSNEIFEKISDYTRSFPIQIRYQK